MKIIKSVILLMFSASVVFAQSLSGVKVCIDPGHGGHDASNDRHVVVANYWESEGNYYKALHVKEILTSLGATVILTRHGNSDSDDIALSARDAIANNNNVDLFHSIHSNATGTSSKTNFSLVLFRGYTDDPVYPAAKTYARRVYRNLEKVNHVLNKSWDVIYGDWSFYSSWGKSGLGVLRYLTMPGVLSEGSFHDYLPEAWRLKNSMYLRHEAWAITRSMLEHFNGGTLTTGIIAGILRDANSNVPSSYQPISALSDSKKPVNAVKATLMPGNIVYNGDDQNNGYFFFENLTPGTYKIYLTAEDYSVDSATVTVSANQSKFIYKYLTVVPNENIPTVLSSFPLDNTTGYSNAGKVEIQFDIRMDKTSTQAAFSISPSVSGKFSWEDNQKKLIFNPTSNFTQGQKYTVSVSTAAKTVFGKNLANRFSFTFTTRSKLNMLRTYPVADEKDVSKSVQVVLQFDNAINPSTLPGNISFLDSEGKFVNLTVDYNAYSQGKIAFTPRENLIPGKTYKVVVGNKIGDIEGVTFQEDVEINFTVEKETYLSGTIVDNFESAGKWNSPKNNSLSIGLGENSAFEISNSKHHGGIASGKATYSYTSDEGYYKISKIIPAAVSGNVFGLWILGDLSDNEIEYWFKDAASNLHSVVVDTLNYTGWKMESVKLSDVASGELKFEGFAIRRTASGKANGEVFIDDAQYDFTVPVKENMNGIPKQFSLLQNYPNPFNPSTVIEYSLPSSVKVELKVYDILGREVMTLVNREQEAGNYKVIFNATSVAGGLSSGVYLYQLRAGNFIATKKLMLVK